ncbi:hypothetical protein [Geminocystis herdmanii]|uniref:hypothetical protein n=1 Tax=Geminocystis herdmanii TaxID=669359 RepID=UPI000346AC25|nr:hypothetical protein [Geminocystis herdmanii]
MSKITYQTLLNTEVTEFCDLIGGFFGKIERDLYKDLEKGKKLNDLKKVIK